jgi:hypothetical protein
LPGSTIFCAGGVMATDDATIHQAAHGYDRVHRLLAASRPLAEDVAAILNARRPTPGLASREHDGVYDRRCRRRTMPGCSVCGQKRSCPHLAHGLCVTWVQICAPSCLVDRISPGRRPVGALITRRRSYAGSGYRPQL